MPKFLTKYIGILQILTFEFFDETNDVVSFAEPGPVFFTIIGAHRFPHQPY